jgi:hypothetical protein
MSGISVTKATYGAGSASVDVTATVASKVKDGVLSFTVSPTALNVDDPAPGQLKQLDITYTVNGGSSNTESAKDNEAVWIDAPPAREASGLQITKAEYGYVGNYTDVTDAVQAMVKDGRIDMKVGFKEVGIPDPNPNKQKDLDVSYTINGAPSSGKFKDGQRFKLDAPPKEERSGKSIKDHANGVIGVVTFWGIIFVIGFLYLLNVFTAYYLGPQLFGTALTTIIGLIPLSMFTTVPFFLFFVRLFYSSDIITADKFASDIAKALGKDKPAPNVPNFSNAINAVIPKTV